MTKAELVQGVIECVSESLAADASGITANSTVIDELGADSLDFMDIMFQLEQKFSIKLQKEDFDLMARLGQAGMKEDTVLSGGMLTPAAKQKLQAWLPTLPLEKDIAPRNLREHITIETLAILVESKLGN